MADRYDYARAASRRKAARRSRLLAEVCKDPERRESYAKQAARLDDEARLIEGNAR